MSTQGLRLALAGGGTGGHLVPGLALLDHWAQHRSSAPLDLLWFQSGRAVEQRVLEGLEARLAPTPVERVQLTLEPPGGGAPSTARILWNLLPQTLLARRALIAHKSDVLLGLGGFTSVPAALAARSLGIPIALLEINATPGRATRLLAPLTRRVFHATEGTCPTRSSERHKITGPPVAPAFRRQRTEDLAAREALGFDPDRPLLVVLGGSQGAQSLNRFITEHDHEFAARGISVFQAVGPKRSSEGAPSRPGLKVVEYSRDVPALLAAATVVLCRGGASTLAEVGAVGTPAVVVPYPHHADRHQERNAALLGEGCLIVQEEDVNQDRCAQLGELLSGKGEEQRSAMRRALGQVSPPNAGESILREIHGLCAGSLA